MEVVSSMHVISLRVQKCYSSSAIPTHSAMPRPILKLLFLQSWSYSSDILIVLFLNPCSQSTVLLFTSTYPWSYSQKSYSHEVSQSAILMVNHCWSSLSALLQCRKNQSKLTQVLFFIHALKTLNLVNCTCLRRSNIAKQCHQDSPVQAPRSASHMFQMSNLCNGTVPRLPKKC